MSRGDGAATQLPLARYEILRSGDPDHVCEVTGRVFKAHRLETAGPLDARMRTVRLRDLSVSVLSYGADVRIGAGRLETFFAVLIPLAGGAEIQCGGERVRSGAGRACVVVPTGDRMRCPYRMPSGRSQDRRNQR